MMTAWARSLGVNQLIFVFVFNIQRLTMQVQYPGTPPQKQQVVIYPPNCKRYADCYDEGSPTTFQCHQTQDLSEVHWDAEIEAQIIPRVLSEYECQTSSSQADVADSDFGPSPAVDEGTCTQPSQPDSDNIFAY